ncbi:hypothetical protein HMPREF0742_01028 [Rothia aeria F0184]|uniref:Uncharacterized protein n=1 Tax=Rothia aeria F0184 TaxID=888019 RepID=U7V497_9MICC|nr:hypothetical protein HMPREF0742_01028 [Rothia aeria F0184]
MVNILFRCRPFSHQGKDPNNASLGVLPAPRRYVIRLLVRYSPNI